MGGVLTAGAGTAADQIAVAEQAIQQIAAEHIQDIELLLRVDSAGASHELLDWAREGRIEFSVVAVISASDHLQQPPEQRVRDEPKHAPDRMGPAASEA